MFELAIPIFFSICYPQFFFRIDLEKNDIPKVFIMVTWQHGFKGHLDNFNLCFYKINEVQ